MEQPTTREILDVLLQFKSATENAFIRIDGRFAANDQRFAAIDQRFTAIDRRFEVMQADMTRRFDSVDLRLDELRREVRGKRKRDDDR
jgi:hypothetical protein